MSSRSKVIGTKAESAVVKVARANGFGQADRHVMKGAKDEGDVWLCPGVIVEVKGGEMARTASDNLVDKWMAEVDNETYHAGASVGFLVVQRRGIGEANAQNWWAVIRHSMFLNLVDPELNVQRPLSEDHDPTIRMLLGSMLVLLRAAGWGDEL